MSSRCNLCVHPAREHIDAMLLLPDNKLEDIREWCIENYPEVPVPNRTGFTRHRTEHLKVEMALLPGNLTIKDGQVFDGSGRPLEQIGIANALKAILTIGVRNILMYPEKVTVKDTIDVLKMMKALGQGEGDLEEMFDMWASTVVKSKPGKSPGRPKKAPIEAPVVVEIVPEDDDPWKDVDVN